MTGGASGSDGRWRRGSPTRACTWSSPTSRKAALAATADELGVFGVRTDVTDAASVAALADATLERFGAVHVVCNNAGVGGGGLDQGPDAQGLAVGDRREPVGCHPRRPLVPAPPAAERRRRPHREHRVARRPGGRSRASAPTTPRSTAWSPSARRWPPNWPPKVRGGGQRAVPRVRAARTSSPASATARRRCATTSRRPRRAPPTKQIADALLAQGIDPSIVAGKVFDAIRANRFWIITHPEYLPSDRRALRRHPGCRRPG